MYEYLFFDLDGTVVDSGLGVTNSVAYALKKRNIEVENRSSLYVFLGPPLVDSFKKYYGFSHEESLECVNDYREYYKDRGIFENLIYDGIVDVIVKAKGMGRKIVLATSKPEEYAVRILEHLGLAKCFDLIAGATMDESRNQKDKVIKYALEMLGITDVSRVIMIGDREHDVIGAAKHGIDTVGVLFGYGDREELECAGAKYIAATPNEILDFI